MAEKQAQEPEQAHIKVRDLTMKYGKRLIQQDLNFDVNKQDIFVIMGGSGCGKSTLLKHMIGLFEPAGGHIYFGKEDFWQSSESDRQRLMQRFGVSYQAGALLSSLTLAQNICMPLDLYTDLSRAEQRELAELKLAMVGLAGFADFFPSEISGGMLKRAALARAIALDPEVVFFDEPSAGLDPISSKLLDDLIVELSESMNSTIVMVTHELASIFAIATNSVFLDAASHTMLAYGSPHDLLENCEHSTVQKFLRRSADD